MIHARDRLPKGAVDLTSCLICRPRAARWRGEGSGGTIVELYPRQIRYNHWIWNMSEIERLLVDYFEAGGAVVEEQDGEWWVFCGRHGNGVSLTGIAIELLRLQQSKQSIG